MLITKPKRKHITWSKHTHFEGRKLANYNMAICALKNILQSADDYSALVFLHK